VIACPETSQPCLAFYPSSPELGDRRLAASRVIEHGPIASYRDSRLACIATTDHFPSATKPGQLRSIFR
jgi:hypothetical protein